MPRILRLLPLLAALFTSLAAAAPAHAASTELTIADDRILLYGSAKEADKAVKRWQELGVDSVRILAFWPRIAAQALRTKRPSYFHPSDPNSRGYNWAAVDGAVNRVAAAGMQPMLTLTGPGPVWSSTNPRRRNGRYKPKPSEYAAFARAAATRYKGGVSRYILWNEPNLNTWLSPQYDCGSGRCTAVAPHVYRHLVNAAYPAIKKADPDAEVLIGTISSRGMPARTSRSTARPLDFVRALGCVDRRYRKLRNKYCTGYKTIRADGFAFHPHGILTAPNVPFPHPDDVNLASIRKLEVMLDKLQRRGRMKPASSRRWNLYLDEFGYQTNPPDRTAGVPPRTQDAWLQRAAYQAWRDPRVKLFSNYLWRDEPVLLGRTYAGWQSGLLFRGGRAKPALKHFATPFVVDGPRSRLWGQVRPGDAHKVRVQRRRGGGPWVTISTRTTDARGFWSLRTRLISGATYRFRTSGGATSAAVRH
jgi:hypothetical protein